MSSSADLVFYLQNKKVSIPADRLQNNINICENSIFKTLFLTHRYDISEEVGNISDDILQAFINWWAGDQPDLTEDNYIGFYKLNKVFKIGFIGDTLRANEHLFDRFRENLDNLQNDSIRDKSIYEELASTKIDVYINSFEDEFMALPIQQLTRIFSFADNDNRIQNHIKAYQAIARKFEQSHNIEIFSLIRFLDGNKLGKDLLKDCFRKKEELHFGFLPKFNVLSIEEDLQSKDRKITELQSEVDSLKSKLDNLFNLFLDNSHIVNLSEQFLPINKNWNKVNANEFNYDDNGITYTLKASSTTENSDNDYSLINLLDGKNENENGKVWVSDYGQNASIEIGFSSPKCVNLISLTSRNINSYKQCPSCFEILARNGNDEFVSLKTFQIMAWYPNEKKFLQFINSQSFTSYKINFISCNFKNSNGFCYGLAELNLGMVKL